MRLPALILEYLQCLWRTITGPGAALRSLASDRRGAVMIIFGLTMIPLMGFAGFAVDYAHAYQLRSRLQSALDSAALAAGREIDLGASQGDAKQTANKVLEANLGSGFPRGYTADIAVDGDTVTATATMNVDTMILGVIGKNVMHIGATSSVRISGGTLEVALVLDNSGSMRGSKLTDLKDAAERLTQILFQNGRTDDRVSMGVVPFAAAVNVGTGYANASWMDRNGDSSIHFENFDSNTTRWSLFDAMRGTSWAGCVEVRPAPHDTTDSTPDAGDALFVPMFSPDEPDRGRSYSNDYLDDDDGSCGRAPRNETEVQAQEKTCKYQNERPSSRQPGPNYRCDPQPLQPLTDSQEQIINSINNMQAEGNTNILEGVMWGWRVLSPGEPFTEGRAYTDDDNRKFMIVMTDGANTHNGASNQNMSRYSAFGYSKNGRLRSPTSSSSRLVEAMNTKTLESCNNAKASEVIVFTIAFDVDDEDTVAMLRQCASGNSRAFSIDNGNALIAVFEAIANEINRLRISS